MILKMINEAELSKKDRKKFIPFVNQRNHMGEIIKNKQKDKQYAKSIQVFQNLKKTTKEYYFDKKYAKMKQKLERCKATLKPKEPDYEKEVSQCFKTIQKGFYGSKFNLTEDSKFNDSNFFYVDLSEKLHNNISTLKVQIERNKKQRMQNTMSQFMKHKTVHSQKERKQPCNTALNTSFNTPFAKTNKENLRQICNTKVKTDQGFSNSMGLSNQHEQSASNDNLLKKRYLRNNMSINRQIFKQLKGESSNMADFTNFGLKYKHLVKAKSLDPWKKWYKDTEVEIFPGQTVNVRRLQKSIYE